MAASTLGLLTGMRKGRTRLGSTIRSLRKATSSRGASAEAREGRCVAHLGLNDAPSHANMLYTICPLRNMTW